MTTTPASTTAPRLEKGAVISDRILQKIYSKIEKGKITVVNAIVVHQTDTSTAESTFNSYKDGDNGAHFLIDKDGTIYQTARVDQKCNHVGPKRLRSRCYSLKTCSPTEMANITKILHNKADSYSANVQKVAKLETAKEYPDRFPVNADSIGIEIVSKFTEKKGYEIVTDAQNASLKWLVATLQSLLELGSDEVFRHPDISAKQPDEAKTANWK